MQAKKAAYCSLLKNAKKELLGLVDINNPNDNEKLRLTRIFRRY